MSGLTDPESAPNPLLCIRKAVFGQMPVEKLVLPLARGRTALLWMVIGIENGPTSASRRAHLLSPAVVSPSPYALHLNAESIWRWGGLRQGGPAVVDPELELFSDAFRWAQLRADYHLEPPVARKGVLEVLGSGLKPPSRVSWAREQGEGSGLLRVVRLWEGAKDLDSIVAGSTWRASNIKTVVLCPGRYLPDIIVEA